MKFRFSPACRRPSWRSSPRSAPVLLIATLVQHPGVGDSEPDEAPKEGHRDALQAVRERRLQVAAESGVSFPEGYPATPTIRKDLETLRQYGILDRRMYRWGYYLGTGAMSLEELRVALQALVSQAKYQGSSQARRIWETLTKRLRGVDLELKGEFFYPVRQQFNRAIVHTDPEEMIERGNNQNTLFHKLDVVERAIIKGQAIEISRSSDPYGRKKIGPMRVWPLQLIYHDIAWYLIFEYGESSHFAVGRINRYKNYCKLLDVAERGMAVQEQRLAIRLTAIAIALRAWLRRELHAHKLLRNGWGLYLGEPEEQSAELAGVQPFETAKVRFFQPVTAFILEGELRHPHQEIHLGPKDESGQYAYVDYTVTLPPRSLKEFSLWVYRHLDNALVLSPRELVEKHRSAAVALASRYEERYKERSRS